MKNITYLAISLYLIGIVSCKKHHTCECLYSNSINGIENSSISETEISPVKLSKKDAAHWCSAYEDSYIYQEFDENLNTVTINSKIECELL